MCVLDTCKTEEDPFKNEGARVVIKRSPIVHLCRFFQGRRRRSGRTASAGPLFGPSMLSAVSSFLVTAQFTFYSDFIQSAKIY